DSQHDGQADFPRHPERPEDRRPVDGRDLPDRRHRHGRPEPQAPEPEREGDGRGARSRRDRQLARDRRLRHGSVRERRIHYPITPEVSQYMQKLVEIFEQYAKMSHHLAFEGVMSTLKLDDPDKFADTLASHLLITTLEKQQLLETSSPYERLQKLQDFLEIEIEKINIDKRINSKVKKQMERAQKEYYLNEKIKAIHHELGRKDDRSDEIEELRQKIEEA